MKVRGIACNVPRSGAVADTQVPPQDSIVAVRVKASLLEFESVGVSERLEGPFDGLRCCVAYFLEKSNLWIDVSSSKSPLDVRFTHGYRSARAARGREHCHSCEK